MKRSTIPLLISAFLALGAAGCSKEKGPTCGQVASHFMSMLKSELAKDADPERLKTARANLPTLQNALFKACQEQHWDQASRQCILDAKTAAETRACTPSASAGDALEADNDAKGSE